MTKNCHNLTNPVGIANAFRTGGDIKGSLVIVIPRLVCELKNIQKGDRFLVALDAAGRIVYQRIETENERGRGFMDSSPSLSTQLNETTRINPNEGNQDD